MCLDANIYSKYIGTQNQLTVKQINLVSLRGLVGYRSVFSSDTRGTGFMHRAFQCILFFITIHPSSYLLFYFFRNFVFILVFTFVCGCDSLYVCFSVVMCLFYHSNPPDWNKSHLEFCLQIISPMRLCFSQITPLLPLYNFFNPILFG